MLICMSRLPSVKGFKTTSWASLRLSHLDGPRLRNYRQRCCPWQSGPFFWQTHPISISSAFIMLLVHDFDLCICAITCPGLWLSWWASITFCAVSNETIFICLLLLEWRIANDWVRSFSASSPCRKLATWSTLTSIQCWLLFPWFISRFKLHRLQTRLDILIIAWMKWSRKPRVVLLRNEPLQLTFAVGADQSCEGC